MKFFLRLTLLFLIFSGLYAILIHFVSPVKIPKQSWWQHNRVRVESFLTEGKDAKYVIVGSSMSDRMLPEQDSGWFNLSLVGEGGLTGLSILNRSDSVPKFVFIEVNQLSVKENEKFSKENTDPFFVFTRRNFPILRSEKQPLNYAVGFVIQFTDRFFPKETQTKNGTDEEAVKISKKLKEDHIQEVKRWYGAAVEQKKLNERTEYIAGVLGELRSKGIRPVFFEMPMHPEILISAKETRTRDSILKKFPPSEYLWFRDQTTVYEDSDGLHLTYPEANRFFHKLKEYADSLP
ncbi:hypothetical protein [Leptospira sarikeiensis]|uniref:SGNH/GDSL hydrolase family protein n=1 Tax=Leptospira sarikeiensis TaxID=2484943 RepID=A0A4R9KC21_9LEPT|nr:hypothetical protein [Leptospira sarikeiensis]TGL64304.1 hypothetical protein EHQ64_02955 [Leptospira sarikeiensis]